MYHIFLFKLVPVRYLSPLPPTKKDGQQKQKNYFCELVTRFRYGKFLNAVSFVHFANIRVMPFTFRGKHDLLTQCTPQVPVSNSSPELLLLVRLWALQTPPAPCCWSDPPPPPPPRRDCSPPVLTAASPPAATVR